MSFLYDASILPGPASTAFHNEGASRSTPLALDPSQYTRPLRTAQSRSLLGRLSPLVNLVRDPVGAIGSAVGGITSAYQNNKNDALADKAEQTAGERRLLYLRMRAAASFEDWRSCAMQLDILEGNHSWREQEKCDEYDYQLVAARIRQLEDARAGCDLRRMIFLLRTSLTRGLGGMGALRLYQHSHLGTKTLIEKYIESCKATISAVVELSTRPGAGVGAKKVMEDIICSRQAFGRSALLLSGGGTFGMNHIGVVKSLWEAKLLPRIISGSSAGSIVCAVLCAKTDDELPQTLEEFCHGDLAVFELESEENGILPKLSRLLKYGAVFEVDHLVRVMKGLLGDMTFQEAYNRTRRILNICVSSPGVYELPRLLNYVTSPNVIIWSAVAASCSVPLIFQAATIYAKDPKTGSHSEWHGPGLSPQRWIDGSVDNDLPMTRLAEMFNVNHFIVSQVNPHVVPFLAKEDDLMASRELGGEDLPSAVEAGSGWLHQMANLAKGEALHRMQVLAELGVFPTYMTKARSVLSQRYSGDITILPAVSYAQFPRVLRNPTPEFMEQAMHCGERATWPKLSRISNHCAIELALDEAVHKLRSKVAFSPSQVDLRLAGYAAPKENSGNELRRHRSTRSTGPTMASIHTKREGKGPAQTCTPKRKGPLHVPVDVCSGGLELSSGKKPTPTEILSSSTADSFGNASIINSSDEDGEASSSEESPPERMSRRRMSFRSQPATPTAKARDFFGSASSPLSFTTKYGQNANIQSSRKPSEPEKRYKRLFHSPNIGTSKSRATIASPSLSSQILPPEASDSRIQRDASSTLNMPLKIGGKLNEETKLGTKAATNESGTVFRKKKSAGAKRENSSSTR